MLELRRNQRLFVELLSSEERSERPEVAVRRGRCRLRGGVKSQAAFRHLSIRCRWIVRGPAKAEAFGFPSSEKLTAASGRASNPYAAFMFQVTNERFEELAGQALATLPEELAAQIDNLAVIVEDRADGDSLFGLYEGIPLTKRSPISYSAVMPDRITLYQSTICRYCANEEEVTAQIRKTVIHEVAHHFGISDPRLEELGWA